MVTFEGAAGSCGRIIIRGKAYSSNNILSPIDVPKMKAVKKTNPINKPCAVKVIAKIFNNSFHADPGLDLKTEPWDFVGRSPPHPSTFHSASGRHHFKSRISEDERRTLSRTAIASGDIPRLRPPVIDAKKPTCRSTHPIQQSPVSGSFG
jgi:hypothetical protein